jgi:hypothetical protein
LVELDHELRVDDVHEEALEEERLQEGLRLQHLVEVLVVVDVVKRRRREEASAASYGELACGSLRCRCNNRLRYQSWD